MSRLSFVLAIAPTWSIAASLALAEAPDAGVETNQSITAIDSVLVGQEESSERPTGCSVVLFPKGAVVGVDVRGGAPGTREIALLDPVATVQRVHAIVLTGGSAFGLDASTGVVRYLEEKQIGFPTPVGRVPIVTSAVLFDLHVGGKPKIRPDAAMGYAAAGSASSAPVAEGSVGAGSGATVGKLLGIGRAMKGGIGSWAVRLDDGTIVAALVAVNPVGNVVDPKTGKPVAGCLSADRKSIVDAGEVIRSRRARRSFSGSNTTIGVVVTNAALDKSQATKLAQMAQDGLARAIQPSHTPLDGDTIFAAATGDRQGEADLLTLGALAADVTAEAILRAVRQAESVSGSMSVQELKESR